MNGRMPAIGPSRHIAVPRDLGRFRREAAATLASVENDPKATFGAQLTVRLENLPPHLSLPAVLGSLLGDQVLAT